jgi:cytochrome c oxidase subunit 2
VQKFWAFLFGGVMAATVIIWPVSYAVGWWLPKNVSTYGHDVDRLFFIILAITGFFFILTEAIMAVFMFKYAGELGKFGPGSAQSREAPVKESIWMRAFKPIIPDAHRLEMAWTIVPAGILLYIAFAQISTWEDIKYYSKMPVPGKETQQLEVSARQFEWRVRYPSLARMNEWKANPKAAEDFGSSAHEDDIWVVNEVHVWQQNKVLVHLKTKDVIHSFYLPNLRLKQDALPGKTIPVWFMVEEANTVKKGDRWVDGYHVPKEGAATEDRKNQMWELACAELCGWGHYKMIGRLFVHKDEADFRAWLQHTQDQHNLTRPDITTTAAR